MELDRDALQAAILKPYFCAKVRDFYSPGRIWVQTTQIQGVSINDHALSLYFTKQLRRSCANWF